MLSHEAMTPISVSEDEMRENILGERHYRRLVDIKPIIALTLSRRGMSMKMMAAIAIEAGDVLTLRHYALRFR